MSTLQFQSLQQFFDGTKDMVKAQAYQLAKAEYSILANWIDATPAAQKFRRQPDVDRFVDYFGDLKTLLYHCEYGTSSAEGHKKQLIENALRQWANNIGLQS